MKNKIVFLLDESNSMHSIKEQTISGFNEYVNSIKKSKDTTLTLTKFNSAGVKVAYLNKDIKKVKEMTEDDFQPNALTPLYDAIGKTIKRLEKELEKEKEDCRVVFIIMTDGEENHSREYDKDKIKKLIDEKENNWTFVYLGADQDAWLEAKKFGMKSAGSTMSFASKDIGETMSKVGKATAKFMSTSKLKSDEFVTDYMSD